jgi:GT2 family glycosyltransferase
MKVTFITVCYNTPNLIRVLLRGVQRMEFSFPYEYLLVDNGNDGTGEMIKAKFPWVTVIQPGSNLGFARAHNLAFKQARGEFVMLLNPDLTVFQGQMERLLEHAERHSDVGILGPLLEAPSGMRQESCTRFPTPMIPLYNRTVLGKLPRGRRMLDWYHMRDIDHGTPHEAETVYGAAMLIRRQALEAIGWFDERFFMYFEDVDLCRRMWEARWKIHFVPSARFVHYHQRESVIHAPWELFTNRLTRVHIASAIKYFLKYSHRSKTAPVASYVHEGSETQKVI